MKYKERADSLKQWPLKTFFHKIFEREMKKSVIFMAIFQVLQVFLIFKDIIL